MRVFPFFIYGLSSSYISIQPINYYEILKLFNIFHGVTA